MLKIWTQFILVGFLTLSLAHCKGGSERIDLSKKTAKCPTVFENEVLPMLNDRLDLIETMTRALSTTPDVETDKEKLYCDIVFKLVDSSQIAIANTSRCTDLAQQTFQAYGGCSQYSNDIKSGCSDDNFLVNHALDNYPETLLHPSVIFTRCEAVIQAAASN